MQHTWYTVVVQTNDAQRNPVSIQTKAKTTKYSYQLSYLRTYPIRGVYSVYQKWKFIDILQIPKQIKYDLKSALFKLWRP